MSMHRVSERVFQAKADLALCERAIKQCDEALAALAGLPRSSGEVKKEREYWALRAESDRGIIAVETTGEW
jgi:hypothetical protein